MTTFKLWDCINTDDPDSGDYTRKRIRRKFPTIQPPERKSELNDPHSVIVKTMQESPQGTQAVVGNIPISKGAR